MTTEQMLDILKEYGIESREQFLREYQKNPGIDIGILTQPIRKQETA